MNVTAFTARHGGRVVKTIGDEAMCVFRRADDAVAAAIEIQSTIDSKRPGKYHVQMHIGLHYGPVLVEDSDVYGDTVNAAAYLTAVAAAEQVLTTEATERNLSPELKSSVRPVFKSVLKGSTEESTVYQVVWHKDLEALTDVAVELAALSTTATASPLDVIDMAPAPSPSSFSFGGRAVGPSCMDDFSTSFSCGRFTPRRVGSTTTPLILRAVSAPAPEDLLWDGVDAFMTALACDRRPAVSKSASSHSMASTGLPPGINLLI